MRDSIFIFHRDGEPVAELHLDLSDLDLVQDARWQGDPAIQALIQPLPEVGQRSLTPWIEAVRRAATRAGLEFTRRYEGEPRNVRYDDLRIRDTRSKHFLERYPDP